MCSSDLFPSHDTSPGIGANYIKNYNSQLNKFKGQETNETYRTQTGHKIALPTYWRNKLYNDQEREALWIQKLNKQERWVGGERIDISKGDQEYYETLEWYRKRNQELGFGTGKINWTRQQYEEERRQAKLLIRIQ